MESPLPKIDSDSEDEVSDIVMLSAPVKKKARTTIDWDQKDIRISLLCQVYASKPYGKKKKIAAYDEVAAILNSTNEHFRDCKVSGANVLNRVSKAVADYVGTYLSDRANKSGRDGDLLDLTLASNSSTEMAWAKKLHDELKAIEEEYVLQIFFTNL
jgi:hypothetical protein